MELHKDLGLDTLIQHYGEEEKVHGAVAPPIYQNSLFVFDSIDELGEAMSKTPSGPQHHYSRISNPSLDIVEQKLAMLEGTETCKVLGSGQAALTMAVMSCVKQGSHIVCVDTAYGPLMQLVGDYLARFGISHTFVDGSEVNEVVAAIRPETTAIYLESPSSLIFRLQDMGAIAQIAKERGISTICDNTYNTPLHMKPHDIGIDIVCHSATKYLGGHSDLTAGILCTSNERMEKIVRYEVNLLGSILHPFQAWLLNRSLRTLSLRLSRHEETGNAVASWLEARDEIERVNHIGLATYPQRDLYKRMMSGSGGLFSFEPKIQDPVKIKAFCDSLNIFQRGVSWGGFESLVVTMPVKPLGYDRQTWVVRLFCGLEDPKDLIADLKQGMGHLAEER